MCVSRGYLLREGFCIPRYGLASAVLREGLLGRWDWSQEAVLPRAVLLKNGVFSNLLFLYFTSPEWRAIPAPHSGLPPAMSGVVSRVLVCDCDEQDKFSF